MPFLHSLRPGRLRISHDTHSIHSGFARWAPRIGIQLLLAVVLCIWAAPSLAMDTSTRESLRDQTVELFYHGYDNYMHYGFPEDELRPVSCMPLTRDRENPAHVELNDVLGNYSLTLIDSLSTLAIMASSVRPETSKTGRDPLGDFQDGVKLLVEYYGDGTDGPGGQGRRARGFDLDSKVQIFETVIRGVGGLLSAHLFAIGDLPILGYTPANETHNGFSGIHWQNGLVYSGQLLRLARDLAERLLPAFYTPTGLPYPRVNLRYGVAMYPNSPLNQNSDSGECPRNENDREITETCSAGAGSLVLEFSTLSRLTGDERFEKMGKNAFWSVWKRRSAIGLIGSGIDAETGLWVAPYTGIGAGIDSFFEYALKSHILLSGLPYDATDETQSPDEFLRAWQESHEAIKRHIHRGQMFQHPHYIQADLYTGAARAFWVDSLSAYYPGLLTLAGEVEEATSAHLLYTALWSRYAAIPERWSTSSGDIESGLKWWGGRPEFIESSWYLYRATEDPWYLHIGEMVLNDIQRRCWTECGWAGLQDVGSGQLTDRMESFFLGETAKYLFLLFDEKHPLNSLDAPFVFTTEGHPLIIRDRQPTAKGQTSVSSTVPVQTCPKAPLPIPLTRSVMAARNDVFHAAHFAQTHLKTSFSADASISPTNYAFIPWTLPKDLIPVDGTCASLKTKLTFELSFPTLQDMPPSLLAIQRVVEGVYVTSISGIRLGMIKEPVDPFNNAYGDVFRIYSVSSVTLGRDEMVFLSREAVLSLNPIDHYFTRIRDLQRVDVILDVPSNRKLANQSTNHAKDKDVTPVNFNLANSQDPSMLSALIKQLQSMLKETLTTTGSQEEPTPAIYRHMLEASLPTGPGAAPIESLDAEPAPLREDDDESPLQWNTIYISQHNLCTHTLPASVPREYQVIVAPRGGCSFATKLEHIPSFPPSPKSLQVVIIVSYDEQDDANRKGQARFGSSSSFQIQPFLDHAQMTPAGLTRAHPIPMIMVPGGEETMTMMRRTGGIALRRKWWFESQGVRIDNLVVI
jgi:Glycosyl hydrolase family 47